jgi:hypothetical protein
MQTNVMRAVAVGFFLILALIGCTRVWYVRIDPKPDGSLEFCVSARKGCSSPGVQLHSVDIYEVDAKNRMGRPIWSIDAIPKFGEKEGIDYSIMRRFTYGVVPRGYRETFKAQPLREGVYYTLNHEFFFYLSGGKVVVMSHAEFSRFLG